VLHPLDSHVRDGTRFAPRCETPEET
jgi:hypothetical protein